MKASLVQNKKSYLPTIGTVYVTVTCICVITLEHSLMHWLQSFTVLKG